MLNYCWLFTHLIVFLISTHTKHKYFFTKCLIFARKDCKQYLCIHICRCIYLFIYCFTFFISTICSLNIKQSPMVCLFSLFFCYLLCRSFAWKKELWKDFFKITFMDFVTILLLKTLYNIVSMQNVLTGINCWHKQNFEMFTAWHYDYC